MFAGFGPRAAAVSLVHSSSEVSRRGSVAGASPVLVEPDVNFLAIEAKKMPDFVVGDSSLGDEPANVPHAGGDVLGDAACIEQLTSAVRPVVVGATGSHVCLPMVKVCHSSYGHSGRANATSRVVEMLTLKRQCICPSPSHLRCQSDTGPRTGPM